MESNSRRDEYSEEEDDEALSFSGMILNDDVEGEGPNSPESWTSLDFEFSRTSSGTPDADPAESFPADLFFSNGHLLPHVFPLPPEHSLFGHKDSTASSSRCSRQNSWTTASSASLDFADGALKKVATVATNTRVKKPAVARCGPPPCFVAPRWQFLFPAPARSLSGSGSVGRSHSVRPRPVKKASNDEPGILSWLVRKFFRTLVSACRDCHSLQPVIRDDCTVAGK